MSQVGQSGGAIALAALLVLSMVAVPGVAQEMDGVEFEQDISGSVEETVADEEFDEKAKNSSSADDSQDEIKTSAQGMTVYVGSYRGYLHALDAESGNENWRFDTNGSVSSSPIVADGTVYVGSDNGELYAIDAESGEQQWQFNPSGSVNSSPTIVDGTVYVGSSGGYVYAIDAESGEQQWQFETLGPVRSSPNVVNKTVYVGSVRPDNALAPLYAIDAESGEQRWVFDGAFGDIRSSPTVINGVVYIGFDDGSLHAIDAESGEQKWKFDVDIRSSPVVVNGTVYVTRSDSDAYAIDAESGEQKWKFDTNLPGEIAPTVQNGTVYVTGKAYDAYAIDTESGDKQWRFRAGDSHILGNSPTAFDGNVYLATRSDGMYTLDAKSGEKIWESDLDFGLSSSPTVVTDPKNGDSLDSLVRLGTNGHTDHFADGTNPAEISTFEPAVVGDRATFTASYDGGGAKSINWEFENGKTVTTDGRTISHIFNESGKTTVKVRITDEQNNTYVGTKTLTVQPKDSPINISVLSDNQLVEEEITLEASIDNASAIAYDWEFQNGKTVSDNGSTITQVFEEPGYKQIKVTVDTENDETYTQTTQVLLGEIEYKPGHLDSSEWDNSNPLITDEQISFRLDFGDAPIKQYREWEFSSGENPKRGGFVGDPSSSTIRQFNDGGEHKVGATVVTQDNDIVHLSDTVKVADIRFSVAKKNDFGTVLNAEGTQFNVGYIYRLEWDGDVISNRSELNKYRAALSIRDSRKTIQFLDGTFTENGGSATAEIYVDLHSIDYPDNLPADIGVDHVLFTKDKSTNKITGRTQSYPIYPVDDWVPSAQTVENKDGYSRYVFEGTNSTEHTVLDLQFPKWIPIIGDFINLGVSTREMRITYDSSSNLNIDRRSSFNRQDTVNSSYTDDLLYFGGVQESLSHQINGDIDITKPRGTWEGTANGKIEKTTDISFSVGVGLSKLIPGFSDKLADAVGKSRAEDIEGVLPDVISVSYTIGVGTRRTYSGVLRNGDGWTGGYDSVERTESRAVEAETANPHPLISSIQYFVAADMVTGHWKTGSPTGDVSYTVVRPGIKINPIFGKSISKEWTYFDDCTTDSSEELCDRVQNLEPIHPSNVGGFGTLSSEPRPIGELVNSSSVTSLSSVELDDRSPAIDSKGHDEMMVWARNGTDGRQNIYWSGNMSSSEYPPLTTNSGVELTTPEPIAETDAMQAQPDVAVTGDGRAIATWIQLNMSRQRYSAMDLNESLSDAQVMHAMYNGTNWSEPKALTNTSAFPSQPKITLKGKGSYLNPGIPMITWQEQNIDSNVSTSRVRYSLLNQSSGEFDSIQTIENASQPKVRGMYEGAKLAYRSLAGDEPNLVGGSIENGTLVDKFIVPTNSRTFDTNGRIIWSNESGIFMTGPDGFDPSGPRDTTTEQLPASQGKPVQDLSVVTTNRDVGYSSIVMYEPVGGDDELTYMVSDGTEWNEPRQLVASQRDVRFRQADATLSNAVDNPRIRSVFLGEESMNINSTSSLFTTTTPLQPDLNLSADIDGSVDSHSVGDQVTVEYTVENTGDFETPGDVEIALVNGSGVVKTRMLDKFYPDNKASGTFTTTVDDSGKLSVVVDPDDTIEELNKSNNRAEWVFERPEIAVTNLTERYQNGTQILSMTVESQGNVSLDTISYEYEYGGSVLANESLDFSSTDRRNVTITTDSSRVTNASGTVRIDAPGRTLSNESEQSAYVEGIHPDVRLIPGTTRTVITNESLALEVVVANKGRTGANPEIRIRHNGSSLGATTTNIARAENATNATYQRVLVPLSQVEDGQNVSIIADEANATSTTNTILSTQIDYPRIRAFNVTQGDGPRLAVEFRANRQLILGSLDLDITGPTGSNISQSNVTQTTDNGTYIYRATVGVGTEGEYTVELTDAGDIEGNDVQVGQTDSAIVEINDPPQADISLSTSPPGTDDPAQFDALGSSDPDGDIVSYEWDFTGDGNFTTSDDATTSYNYTEAGTYNVTLRVTDDDGATNTTTNQITVLPAPTISDYNVTSPDNQTIRIAFTSDKQLDQIQVVANSTTNATTTLRRGDFTEQNVEDGYEYVAVTNTTAGGTYNVTLEYLLDSEGVNAEPGKTVTVEVGGVTLGPVGNFQNPPSDQNGDGLYRDINGDGSVDVADVQALAMHLDDPTIQNNTAKFDFDGNGTIGEGDVGALFDYVTGQNITSATATRRLSLPSASGERSVVQSSLTVWPSARMLSHTAQTTAYRGHRIDTPARTALSASATPRVDAYTTGGGIA